MGVWHCLVVNFNTYFFLRDKLPISVKMLVFFLAKCVRNAVKTMVVDRKNQKALALLYLASKPLRKAAKLKRCADRVWTEPTRQIWTFCLNFIAEFLSRRLNFPLPPKRQLSVLLNFFFRLTNLFLTFVVFACFATTRVNMRFRAENTRDSPQGYIQCRKCIGSRLVRTDGRTDVQTDGHVTTTSLPKFFGLIDYQISLAMELHWRARALAPLLTRRNTLASMIENWACGVLRL